MANTLISFAEKNVCVFFFFFFFFLFFFFFFCFFFFFNKNICELDILLTDFTRTVNILTTKELFKLTMFWATGPWTTIVRW